MAVPASGMRLKVVVALLTAVLVGGGYRWMGGEPSLVPLVSLLSGFGGLAAVELALFAGWL